MKKRFLIDSDNWMYQGIPTKIIMGYLVQDMNKKIIIKTSSNGCSLLINSYEYSIPKKDAHEMLKICENNLIKKIQYKYKFEGRTWYINIYKDENEGLIVGEVEYDDNFFKKPIWCLDEITDKSYYTDEQLSVRPFTEW